MAEDRLLWEQRDLALVRCFWEDEDIDDWGSHGSDLVLLRGFESLEDILLRCVVERARLRVRVTAWDDGAEAISRLVWGGGICTGADL